MQQSIFFGGAATWRRSARTARLRGRLAAFHRAGASASASWRSCSTGSPTSRSSGAEDRRQRIAEGLANAEKIKAELAKTEAARRKILKQASSQANKIIEEARAAAARVQEQETQKAIATANQIIAKAREAAEPDWPA